MLRKNVLALAVLAVTGAMAMTAQASSVKILDNSIMREATEAPRGADAERPGDRQNRGGKFGVENKAADQLAREATSQRQRRRGGAVIETDHTDSMVLAREASSQRQRRRGAVIETDHADSMVVAREASEGPRGGDNERPGDRQNRGGKFGVDHKGADMLAREGSSRRRGGAVIESDRADSMVLAREASEGPRGADNERPGDRQRRRGRQV